MEGLKEYHEADNKLHKFGIISLIEGSNLYQEGMNDDKFQELKDALLANKTLIPWSNIEEKCKMLVILQRTEKIKLEIVYRLNAEIRKNLNLYDKNGRVIYRKYISQLYCEMRYKILDAFKELDKDMCNRNKEGILWFYEN